MPNLLNSEAGKYWGLVPTLYYVATRVDQKQVVFNIATALAPSAWLALRLSDLPTASVVYGLVLAYLAFVVIYEVGYFANDTWGAAREGAGRKRIAFTFGRLYVVLFVAIRLIVWLVVGVSTGWLLQAPWLAFFAALAVVFVLHNVLIDAARRSGTFLQLSVLRFLAPIVPVVAPPLLGPVMLIGLVFYSVPRYLTYLDSKGLLRMPERQTKGFRVAYVLLLAPVAALVAYYSSNIVAVEIWAYYVAVYGIWFLVADRRGHTAVRHG